MSADFFALYNTLLEGVDSSAPVLSTAMGEQWCLTATAGGLGIAMHTPGSSIPPLYPQGLLGLPLAQAAQAVRSWNLEEASFGLAAVNACYNTPARLAALDAAQPTGGHYADGLDFTGLRVGIVGHMRGPAGLREKAREVYVLERNPWPGDYPDSACELLLPRCDLVIITGSSLINKTLPRLLALCRNAYTILTGPSVPLCPALLDFGIDRISGLVVTQRAAMTDHVRQSLPGNPYFLGQGFLLCRD